MPPLPSLFFLVAQVFSTVLVGSFCDSKIPYSDVTGGNSRFATKVPEIFPPLIETQPHLNHESGGKISHLLEQSSALNQHRSDDHQFKRGIFLRYNFTSLVQQSPIERLTEGDYQSPQGLTFDKNKRAGQRVPRRTFQVPSNSITEYSTFLKHPVGRMPWRRKQPYPNRIFGNFVEGRRVLGFRIFRCKNEGYFRDPDNCNVFHRCVVYQGINSIYKFTFRCGPGLVFDKTYQVCNYPDSVYPRCIVGLDEDSDE